MIYQHRPRRDFRLWCSALTAMLVLTGVAVSVTQKQDRARAIENFGKVNENYYRGSQPRSQQLAWLKARGVKTVIDLRKDSVAEEPSQVSGFGMQYFNIPLKPSIPATAAQTEYFLKLVNDPQNWPVYVHCKGGRHRTGALTAIYRITHDGWTADQAWEEMKRYDFDQGFFRALSAEEVCVFVLRTIREPNERPLRKTVELTLLASKRSIQKR